MISKPTQFLVYWDNRECYCPVRLRKTVISKFSEKFHFLSNDDVENLRIFYLNIYVNGDNNFRKRRYNAQYFPGRSMIRTWANSWTSLFNSGGINSP